MILGDTAVIKKTITLLKVLHSNLNLTLSNSNPFKQGFLSCKHFFV